MNNYRDNFIYKYVHNLGFSPIESRIYLALIEAGPLTISELARRAGVERTALYRLLPHLTERGLIEELLEQKSKRYEAASPNIIEKIVAGQKDRVETLDKNFSKFVQELDSRTGRRETKTRYYRGVEGIKQILWNETKAKGPIVAYTYRNLEEVVGVKYFRKYAAEIEKNRLTMRDLRSDAFLASMKEPKFVRIHIEGGTWRYLPDKILHLTHNMDIYDETTAIYYWEDNDVFGIEIQNKQIADTQRSIFEALWKIAKKL